MTTKLELIEQAEAYGLTVPKGALKADIEQMILEHEAAEAELADAVSSRGNWLVDRLDAPISETCTCIHHAW